MSDFVSLPIGGLCVDGTRFDPNATILAGASPAQLQGWLASAQNAYAQLMSGAKVVSAAFGQADNSRSVTWTQANKADLAQWIMLLQRQLGIPGAGRRRPMRPFYR